ncbi:MAG TPA: hypothetical protein PKX23_10965 [Verrucomicrobiota bacterium]|nr:hypothetical protein [Verrucomicrobiota bacterium]HRT07330.1 hypothetical protein [Candidatus Paceibacterota bacterium]HRT56782.1 hypothetical protein [Candidatus Paceibacterota bacterium]
MKTLTTVNLRSDPATPEWATALEAHGVRFTALDTSPPWGLIRICFRGARLD